MIIINKNAAANLPEPICEDRVWGFFLGCFFLFCSWLLGIKVLFSVCTFSPDGAWRGLFLVSLQPELWKWVSSRAEDGHEVGSMPVVKETWTDKHRGLPVRVQGSFLSQVSPINLGAVTCLCSYWFPSRLIITSLITLGANMEKAQGGNGAGVFISRAQEAHNQCHLETKPDGLR